ncbi:MAG: ATP-binding protein [Desulfobacterales bacterium]
MNIQAWKPLISHFFMGGADRAAADLEVLRKVVLLNIVCSVGIVVLIPMGVLAFSQATPYLAIFDITVAMLLCVNLFNLRRKRNVAFVSYSGIAVLMVLYWFLVFTGGVNKSAYVWCYTLPLAAMFLLGARHGLYANLIFFLPVILFLIFEPNLPQFTTYPRDLKLRIIPSYFVVLGYAYLFEWIREKSDRELKREIDERRRTAHELEAAKLAAENANRAKSEFLANMSHELRTPLNHIIGFTDLVVNKHFGELTETQEEYLNDVLTSSGHLLSLINDILDLSKVEAGKMELNPGRVDLPQLLENSLSMIKEKAIKQGIQLTTEIDGIPATITADARKLKQIIYNLLSNAVKFTPRKGKITLGARCCVIEDGKVPTSDGRMLTLAGGNENSTPGRQAAIQMFVQDTGIGIENEALEYVFRPFEQVERSMSRNYQGTGLGLSLTRNFVELHGGAIWVVSQGADAGSTFFLVIPTLTGSFQCPPAMASSDNARS